MTRWRKPKMPKAAGKISRLRALLNANGELTRVNHERQAAIEKVIRELQDPVLTSAIQLDQFGVSVSLRSHTRALEALNMKIDNAIHALNQANKHAGESEL